MILQGRVWKLGDNVDTDQLLPGRYLNLTDPAELAAHCLEDVLPHFRTMVRAGDIIVAGENFGCGSSREHAPIALKAAGISGLVARSFSRIFFRNCINLGLPVLTLPQLVDMVQDGDQLRLDLTSGWVENLTRSYRCSLPPLPGFLQEILIAGGLVPYVRLRRQRQQGLEEDER